MRVFFKTNLFMISFIYIVLYFYYGLIRIILIIMMIGWITLWKTTHFLLSIQHINYNINLYKILRIFIIFIIILNVILTH